MVAIELDEHSFLEPCLYHLRESKPLALREDQLALREGGGRIFEILRGNGRRHMKSKAGLLGQLDSLTFRLWDRKI